MGFTRRGVTRYTTLATLHNSAIYLIYLLYLSGHAYLLTLIYCNIFVKA